MRQYLSPPESLACAGSANRTGVQPVRSVSFSRNPFYLSPLLAFLLAVIRGLRRILARELPCGLVLCRKPGFGLPELCNRAVPSSVRYSDKVLAVPLGDDRVLCIAPASRVDTLPAVVKIIRILSP